MRNQLLLILGLSQKLFAQSASLVPQVQTSKLGTTQYVVSITVEPGKDISLNLDAPWQLELSESSQKLFGKSLWSKSYWDKAHRRFVIRSLPNTLSEPRDQMISGYVIGFFCTQDKSQCFRERIAF